MTEQQIVEHYQSYWDDFVARINEVQAEIGRAASGSASLHTIVSGMHWTPYHLAHQLVDQVEVDETASNVGAVTGLFFELAVAAALVPFVRSRCAGVRVERNCCTDRPGRYLPRDPDLYFVAGERWAVVEIKVSPKRRDFEHLERVRERYEAAGIAFFLVGGHVSLDQKLLEEYADRRWACFTSASDRNRPLLERLPTLDDVAADLVARLWCN